MSRDRNKALRLLKGDYANGVTEDALLANGVEMEDLLELLDVDYVAVVEQTLAVPKGLRIKRWFLTPEGDAYLWNLNK